MTRRIKKLITYKHEDGSVLEGFRVIDGIRKIRQIVVYNGQYLVDNETYSLGQDGQMEAAAQQIMFEFASGRTLGARVFKESVKF